MTWKENIYFYISVAAISFSLILVYFFYEKQFSLTDFLDVKTILTVLGTVFGAYFGARTAGKFAVESVEKQIKYQKDKDDLKEKRVYEKVVQEYCAHCEGLHSYLLSFILSFEKTKFSSPNEKINVLADAEKFVKPKVQTLKEIDPAGIYGTTYFKIQLMNIGASNLLEIMKNMLEHLDSSEVELYMTEGSFFMENLSKFEGYIYDARKTLE